MTAFIGTLSLEVHIPASLSLKDKRRVLKSLKDRLRPRFNVSVAEIDALDKWQRAVIGICAIANDRKAVEGHLQQVLNFAAEIDDLEIIRSHVELL